MLAETRQSPSLLEYLKGIKTAGAVLRARQNDLEFGLQPGRSTVGHLPLEQSIGVRIPAGLPTFLPWPFHSKQLNFHRSRILIW